MSSDNITSAEVGGNAATSDLIGLEGGAGHTEEGSHAGTLDLTGGDAEMTTANIPDSSRSYSGPTMYQNRWTILCGFTLLVGVGVAIGLSVNSLERSNEALELALESVKELQETNKAVIDAVEDMEDWKQRPAPAVPAASIGPPPATPKPTPEPTSEPTTPAPNTPPPSYAPSESHPLNPKWYHISHRMYQESLSAHAAQNMTIQNGKMKPWMLKNILCQRQLLKPCDYDAYCPNGAGGKPFHGGPPQSEGWEGRKREQWSPLLGEGRFLWVQVGYVPEEDGGKDGSQCVMWDDFAYGNGADILEVRGEPYMEWMLCCEDPEQSTIFDPEGGGER